jgi:hypothetical protein
MTVNFVSGAVTARIDGAAATIDAQTGGIASVTRNAAGDYTIIRGNNTGGWDTDETAIFVSVSGAPLETGVTRVSDDAFRVLLLNNAGAAADATFDLMVVKLR